MGASSGDDEREDVRMFRFVREISAETASSESSPSSEDEDAEPDRESSNPTKN